MDRTTPVAHNEEIELYIRTYYSLLRSSEPIRIRSLEETHAAMDSNLHHEASSVDLDMSALVYSALRLPTCVHSADLVVMGQRDTVFERAGYDVNSWNAVSARARRRKFFYEDGSATLAAFIASVSDIDDVIPCLVAFQIEWNKLHEKLSRHRIGDRVTLAAGTEKGLPSMDFLEEIREALNLDSGGITRLCQVWPGAQFLKTLRLAREKPLDLQVTVLGSGLSDYRSSVQHWWHKVEERAGAAQLAERPIYFVSSNIHSLVNLVSGIAWEMKDEIIDFIHRINPEGLLEEYQRIPEDDTGQLRNFLYYAQRFFLNHPSTSESYRKRSAEREAEIGIIRVSDPHCLDVQAQLFDLSKLNPSYFDPRMQASSDPATNLLTHSNAMLFNIDYPLGMAAYHIFSQVSTVTGQTLGVYILGKAATLNGRVGDVMLPNVVYDEHSKNSYLFRNCFVAHDVAPHLNFGTVFDNQKAVTVRGTLLQNRHFMHVFYEEGYTDIEMEAGPYLSAIYEDIYPKRYPLNEIVNLFINAPYDIGLIHYASDTPISKGQTLLSKSLSYFGVDATYATSVAVLNRLFDQEIQRQRQLVQLSTHTNGTLVTKKNPKEANEDKEMKRNIVIGSGQ
ncbi:MAG: hypothetical protein AAF702_37545 [Chloroflexota bacterium]